MQDHCLSLQLPEGCQHWLPPSVSADTLQIFAAKIWKQGRESKGEGEGATEWKGEGQRTLLLQPFLVTCHLCTAIECCLKLAITLNLYWLVVRMFVPNQHYQYFRMYTSAPLLPCKVHRMKPNSVFAQISSCFSDRFTLNKMAVRIVEICREVA